MQLAGGLAEHQAHAEADVGDAVVAIDRPQPADAALLIFLKQLGRAFAAAADVGVRLELAERPTGDGQHAGDRHAEREDDRQHVLEGYRVAADSERAADAAGEGDHPGQRGRGHHYETEAADARGRP